MYVKHLQEYLDKFTNGKRGNAVSNAKIFMYVNGYLEEIKQQRPMVQDPLKLLQYSCTPVQGSWSLKLVA
jgi:hypothetical protein